MDTRQGTKGCPDFGHEKKYGKVITGEIVPSGSLPGGESNAYSRMTVGERWDEIVNTCAMIMANAMDRRRRGAGSEVPNEFKGEGE